MPDRSLVAFVALVGVLGAVTALGQTPPRLSADETFLTKTRWVSLGDDVATYGLEEFTPGKVCLDQRLAFGADHLLTISCEGQKPLQATWELRTSEQEHVLSVSLAGGGRRDYRIYFRPQDPVGFNLVVMQDGKVVPKTETYFGAG